MIRSPAAGSVAIFLHASRERPRNAVRRLPETDDTDLCEAAAPPRRAIPCLSTSFPGRPNRWQTKINAAGHDLAQALGA